MLASSASRRSACTAIICFFFFQAEDGIRDLTVTGVQTCALPICRRIGNTPLSPAARWSVVDGSRRAARGCRAVDVGVGGRASGSRGAGRTQPRDRGGGRQEKEGGRRRHGTRADARPGGADRGGRRA